MSTILKALRRLEQEKTRPLGGRPLREEVAGTPTATARRGSWKLLAAALATGVALGAVALLVLPERGVEAPAVSGEPATAPVAAAPEADPARSHVPPPAFEPEAEDPGPPPQAFASDVEVVERPAAAPLFDEGEVHAPRPPRAGQLPPHLEAMLARGEARPPPSALAEPVSAPQPAATAPAPPVEARSTSPPPAPLTRDRPAPPPAREVASPAPPVREASSPAPPAAPEVRVEKTVWHPDPKRREAVVSVTGRDGVVRVQEGDTVGLLVVSEIQPTGVRFTHQGVPLERRVGDSD